MKDLMYIVWNNESGEVEGFSGTQNQVKQKIKTIPNNWDISCDKDEFNAEYKRRLN